ncbi:MAG: SUMF1/EgtB/PvdO family nonheme iron enzyme [Dechloromonas sp.]|nr:SUMF1/EgtB/PvdO family nonheme iron enzyme [Candidatus Dechloromonas phosphoritropha]
MPVVSAVARLRRHARRSQGQSGVYVSDIFICYSRSDRVLADQLVQRLRSAGWSVFLDVQTRVGERWHKTIEREMQAARTFVALWSKRSVDSDYVLEEADYGKRKGILLPAFIERVDFPYGFSRIQTADLVGWAGEADHPGLAQLVDGLRQQLGEQLATPSPGSSAPPSPPRSVPVPVFAPGQTFRDPLRTGGEGPLLVVIPAGRFLMGSPPDEPERSEDGDPQHEVRIAQPFAMGVHALTFADYDRYAEASGEKKPDDKGWGRGRRPVINVSWEDARDYCQWLGEQTGNVYRLPSEAEWEYACRAGTTTPFHFGSRMTSDQANFDGNYTYNGSAQGEYREKTLPVGSFPPNAFGLYDMHGNVWEWCQDPWHGDYQGAPTDGSVWETGGSSSRVLRGGAWSYFPRFCRAASRFVGSPVGRSYDFGFRVCRGAPSEPLPAAAPNTVSPKR